MATKDTKNRDRTDLGNEWAAAVADLDQLREAVALAEKREREAWDALARSRATSVRED